VKYPLRIPALAGSDVALDSSGFWRSTLTVDGRVYKSRRKVFTVERPGRPPLEVRLKARLFDPVPNLEVDGEVVQVVPALQWYEYVWCCLPLALLPLGGALGGAIGGATSVVNVTAFRSVQHPLGRYALAGAITFGAFAAFLLLALRLSMLAAPATP
jgi:hypothetical protein